MASTGAEILASTLKDFGVEFISTLCGNGLNRFYIACRDSGIRLIDTHNEQAAAYMADAYGRLTGRVGVCAVSSGVAHSNALTGVANAYFDGSPMLLITGASAGYGAGRGVFQEYDQTALAAPICKLSKCVYRVGDLEFMVEEAFRTAMEGRPGPVHLTVPLDVMEGEVGEEPSRRRRLPRDVASLQASESLGPDLRLVEEAAKIIRASERPIIVAGSGVFYSGGQEALIRLSEAGAIPIVIPIWDRGSVERSHPNFLGVIGAASGEPRLLEDADLIILVGARVDYRVGFLEPPKVRPDASVMRIDVDASELTQGTTPDVAILSSPAAALNALADSLSRLGGPTHREWMMEARERWRRFRAKWVERSPPPSKPMTGWHIVNALRPLLTEEVVFLIDGGNIGQWAHMVLADRYPSTWLTCGASAVVGWGLPGAMAAKLAYPERPVLLLSGDGAFSFTLAEIEAAVRHGLPFVAVVSNDSAWGLVVSTQKDRYGDERVIASRFGGIRFDVVAEAMGARGLRVEDERELRDAVEEGFSSKVPTVIDVPVSVLGPADVA
ncbi:thiamine pyrophosphate-binding protein [Candidatus Bathyarchaeota archaeon]|nr:MAG: thiamine pyrophosphate-binding protein [Candidatus Bathyarchaeota archaeon]